MIPLAYIFKLDKKEIEKAKAKSCFVELVTKDFRFLRINFDTVLDCNNAFHRMQIFAFPE